MKMALILPQIVGLFTRLILTGTPPPSLTETGTTFAAEWTWPAFVVIPLLLMAILYGAGIAKLLRRGTSVALWPTVWFGLGWISLIIALDSPLHKLGEQLFWVHMTQHEILMLISAPLLLLGRPLSVFLWALPPSLRERAASLTRLRFFKISWNMLSAPLSAWLLSAMALWIWHVPWLFDQTLHNDVIHAAQHTTFFVSALLFWWPVINRTPVLGYGGGLIYVFTTILHTSILGALLTFAARPWYFPYMATAPAWHLTALEDQQLGGLIMWIPAGTLLLSVALVLLVKWMNQSQTRWQYTRMAELTHLSQEGTK